MAGTVSSQDYQEAAVDGGGAPKFGPASQEGRPAAIHLPDGRAKCSDFCLLRDLQGVIDLYSKVTHSGLKLGVAQ